MERKSYKSLAGDLTATFNLDGQHYFRYMAERARVVQGLCEQLILHDQVLIPTADYLTAAGLISILGERTVVSLLRHNEIRFVRMRGVIGYATGLERGSLMISTPADIGHPLAASAEESAHRALSLIPGAVSDRRRLTNLLVTSTYEESTEAALQWVRKDASAQLRETELWQENFVADGDPNLPGPAHAPGTAAVTVIGPDSNPGANPIDALLFLVQANLEAYAAQAYECDSLHTSSPIADMLKARIRATATATGKELPPVVWRLFETHRISDPSRLVLKDRNAFRKFMRIVRSRDALAFRDWVHARRGLDNTEMQAAYNDLLYAGGWSDRVSVRIMRFILTDAVSYVPVIGDVASIVDAFLVDKLLLGRSPRFFVEALRKFSGSIPIAG